MGYAKAAYDPIQTSDHARRPYILRGRACLADAHWMQGALESALQAVRDVLVTTRREDVREGLRASLVAAGHRDGQDDGLSPTVKRTTHEFIGPDR
jgi:hypothetical protein